MPTLNEGDRLEFELEVDRRGKYAAVNLAPSSSWRPRIANQKARSQRCGRAFSWP